MRLITLGLVEVYMHANNNVICLFLCLSFAFLKRRGKLLSPGFLHLSSPHLFSDFPFWLMWSPAPLITTPAPPPTPRLAYLESGM